MPSSNGEHSAEKIDPVAKKSQSAQSHSGAAAHSRSGRAPRKKPDARAQRGEETRELILHVAEKLIYENGPEGVSMRQIGVAVGQGNNSVIQYHFTSKEGLIREIIARRAAQFIPVRQAMLDKAKAEGKTQDVATLLAILMFPIAAKDETGRYVYAGFMARALPTMWGHNAEILRRAWSEPGPVLETMQYLRALRTDLSGWRMGQRVLRLNRMFVSALVDRDKMREIGGKYPDERYFLQDLLNMMTAAFNAPLPEDNGIYDGLND